MSKASVAASSDTTVVDMDNPAHHYTATIVDIDYGSASTGESLKFKRPTVYDVIHGEGPAAIMAGSKPQTRWVHLPANCKAWVEVCTRVDDQ